MGAVIRKGVQSCLCRLPAGVDLDRALVFGARLVCVALRRVCLRAVEVEPLEGEPLVDGLLSERHQPIVFFQPKHALIDAELVAQKRRRYANLCGTVKGGQGFLAPVQRCEGGCLVQPRVCVLLILGYLAFCSCQRT